MWTAIAPAAAPYTSFLLLQTLFVLALLKMQTNPKFTTDPYSYFQLAKVHGMPFGPYNSVVSSVWDPIQVRSCANHQLLLEHCDDHAGGFQACTECMPLQLWDRMRDSTRRQRVLQRGTECVSQLSASELQQPPNDWLVHLWHHAGQHEHVVGGPLPAQQHSAGTLAQAVRGSI